MQLNDFPKNVIKNLYQIRWDINKIIWKKEDNVSTVETKK